MFVPPETIDELPLVSFAIGQKLIEEGTAGAELYFLVDGAVEILKGSTVIARVRERGAMFGEMSVLLACPHTATVRATSEVSCRVSRDPLQYLASHPAVMFYVGRILAHRIESLNRYLVDVKAQLHEQGTWPW
ncbi:MAG: cyclic nucleotide-binding domain-containing protein [Candidatus Hydrogenedentes bacterium]|nr:cyclic nucleotide-binding domain-containing protein [Candidatus Hydrogenedentota bacterium]